LQIVFLIAMKQIFSLTLAILILLSSFSLRLEAHYCGQQIVDISIFGKAAACEMQKENICEESEDIPCCEDRTLMIQGQEFQFSKDFERTEIKKQEVEFLELIRPRILLLEVENSTETIIHYSPPLIKSELRLLFQSFLI